MKVGWSKILSGGYSEWGDKGVGTVTGRYEGMLNTTIAMRCETQVMVVLSCSSDERVS